MADDYSNDMTTTGVLPTGGSVRGVLETAGDSDWFALDVKAFHGYYFTPVMANGQMPLITVWREGSPMERYPQVAYTTQPGGLFSNELYNPFIPITSERYFVEIHGATQAGDYTIGMREAPDDSSNDPGAERVLTEAAPLAGRFDYAFDRDQFRIAAVAGTTYTVTVTADSGTIGTASFLRLSHRDWQITSSEGGATTRYTFTARSSGEYVISADLGSFEPPASGGVAYHISVSTSATSGPGTPIVDPVPPVTGPVVPPVDGPADPPVTPPVVPTDPGPEVVSGAGTVDGAIVVRFSEAALLGHRGSIELRQGSTVVDSWAAGDTRIHLSGDTLTLDPGHTGSLMPGKYSLFFRGNILTDTAGNPGLSYAYNAVDVRGTTGGGVTPVLKGSGDHVRGSDGLADAVVIDGKVSDYIFTRDDDGFNVTGSGRFKGSVSGIERVLFTDSDEVLGLAVDGHLGQAYRLYTSAFDRVPDHEGLGFWLAKAESGVSLQDMARGFIASQEFADLYGAAPDDSAFIAALYQNVLHRAGEPEGVKFWMNALSIGVDRGDVLAAFSEGFENQAQVAELIGNGIVYVPYG